MAVNKPGACAWLHLQPAQVFLDTEGLASYEQTTEEGTTIVSMAGLLSSMLIYNQLGTFNEKCLDSLLQVAGLMHEIYTQSGIVPRPWCHTLESTPDSELVQPWVDNIMPPCLACQVPYLQLHNSSCIMQVVVLPVDAPCAPQEDADRC